MKDNNDNKNKFYPFQKLPKKTNPFKIDLSQNRIQNFKRLSNDSINKKNTSFNLKKSELFTKINIKNIQKNIIDEYEKEISNSKYYYNPLPAKEFYHRKNNFSRELSNSNLIHNNSFLNLTNTSNRGNKKYKIYNQKKLLRNSSESQDYSKKDFKKNYSNSKYNSNYYSNNVNSNTSYDFKKMKYSMPNNKEERRIPIIVVTKKPNKFKTSVNFFQKRKSIIRIQSAWRGYFLRKIAVGSIKKYIGFIALIKYLEKVLFKNIEYDFYEFLFLLKKFCEERKKQKIFRKINNQYNDRLKYNRYKRKLVLNYNTNDDNINNYGHRVIKTNLYKTLDFENFRDKSENNINNKVKIIDKKENFGGNNTINNERDKKMKDILMNKKKLKSNIQNSNDKAKKIVYIPKKLGYKSFHIKNKIYKMEKIVNLIRIRFYLQNYPVFLYKLKLIQKLSLIKFKLNTLAKVIKLVENKYMKKFLKKYRENVIILTAKYEYFNKSNKKIQINALKNEKENQKKIENKNKEFNLIEKDIIKNNSTKTGNLDKNEIVENKITNEIQKNTINNKNDINKNKNKKIIINDKVINKNYIKEKNITDKNDENFCKNNNNNINNKIINFINNSINNNIVNNVNNNDKIHIYVNKEKDADIKNDNNILKSDNNDKNLLNQEKDNTDDKNIEIDNIIKNLEKNDFIKEKNIEEYNQEKDKIVDTNNNNKNIYEKDNDIKQDENNINNIVNGDEQKSSQKSKVENGNKENNIKENDNEGINAKEKNEKENIEKINKEEKNEEENKINEINNNVQNSVLKENNLEENKNIENINNNNVELEKNKENDIIKEENINIEKNNTNKENNNNEEQIIKEENNNKEKNSIIKNDDLEEKTIKENNINENKEIINSKKDSLKIENKENIIKEENNIDINIKENNIDINKENIKNPNEKKSSSISFNDDIKKNIEEKNINKKGDLINNIIIEEEEEIKEINENEKDNILKNKKENIINDLSLLKKLINKKIESEKKSSIEATKKFFNIWKKTETNFIKEKKSEDEKIKEQNYKYLSPYVDKGKIHTKKHIKLKFCRTLTSKTSLSSKKSEEKSNMSGVHVKKMKIKNIVVNPSEYFRNKSSIIKDNFCFNNLNSNDLDFNPNVIKLLKLINKIEMKNLQYKYFIFWKKGKK